MRPCIMPHSSPAVAPQTNATRSRPVRRLRAVTAALGLVALLALVPTASAQSGCTEPEKNVQCTEFGAISMDSQRAIKGETIDISTSVILNTAYTDQGARWLLFSLRNVEADGANPVTIQLTSFASAHGDIVTTKVEQPSASEVSLWVDTLDAPVGTPITISMQVGSTERGAYRLEVLVQAFDRGYSSIKDSSGTDASLFSFTLLGVNKETGEIDTAGGGLSDGKKLPGMGLIAALAAVVVAAAVIGSRRKA